MSRTLFIGDVHGCYDELIALVAKIGLMPDDHLYFVGDLISKGPKSLEVVEWVRARPNTWSVMGNHELFSLLDYSDDARTSEPSWSKIQWQKSETLRNTLREKGHTEWLLSLPTMIEKEDFLLVHGGLHPKYGRETPREDATLIRTHDGRPWYEYYTGNKLVIYGHWAAEGLRVRPNTLGLDTGCCFGGHLTAYCLETREMWQVRANKVYKDPVHWRKDTH